MAVLTELDDYITVTAAMPWAWGRQDCTLWVADWCRRRWLIDPARAFRDRYSTEAESEMLIAEAGDLLSLISPRMVFLRPAPAATDGDVGVIRVMGRQTAAIRSGDKWAFRTPAGVGFAATAALAAWGDL